MRSLLLLSALMVQAGWTTNIYTFRNYQNTENNKTTQEKQFKPFSGNGVKIGGNNIQETSKNNLNQNRSLAGKNLKKAQNFTGKIGSRPEWNNTTEISYQEPESISLNQRKTHLAAKKTNLLLRKQTKKIEAPVVKKSTQKPDWNNDTSIQYEQLHKTYVDSNREPTEKVTNPKVYAPTGKIVKNSTTREAQSYKELEKARNEVAIQQKKIQENIVQNGGQYRMGDEEFRKAREGTYHVPGQWETDAVERIDSDKQKRAEETLKNKEKNSEQKKKEKQTKEKTTDIKQIKKI